MEIYDKVIDKLKDIYPDNEIPEMINQVEKKYKSTTLRQHRRIQELKKELLINFLQDIFSKRVCDKLMLKDKDGNYTIKLKTISNSIHNIDSYEVSNEEEKKVCENFKKTELYIMTILDGIQGDNNKYLNEVIQGFKNTKEYIDNILCSLEKWKNDTNELISSFLYWNDLKREVKKKYITNDIKLLYSLDKDNKEKTNKTESSTKARKNINQTYGLEIEFPLKNEGKERIAITRGEKALNIDTLADKTEIQQMLHKNLKAKQITLDDNTSIYYITDNDEYYSRTYYFLMDKKESEECQVTGLTMTDIATLTALLKLASDKLITDSKITYNFRDIVRTVFNKTRISIKEYKAVYNSLIKLSSFVGRIKSNYNYTTKIYDLIKCDFYYTNDTEKKKLEKNIEIKGRSFESLHVNVRFSSEYTDRLKHAVFLDKKLSGKIYNNKLAKAVSILLQGERYEWHKKCLNNEINKEDEVRLSHRNFFCRQLYLPISGRKIYRDRDNILEVMQMIAEMKTIIQGDVRFDSETWEYCFHFVDLNDDEINEIKNAVNKLRQKVLVPFLPIDDNNEE